MDLKQLVKINSIAQVEREIEIALFNDSKRWQFIGLIVLHVEQNEIYKTEKLDCLCHWLDTLKPKFDKCRLFFCKRKNAVEFLLKYKFDLNEISASVESIDHIRRLVENCPDINNKHALISKLIHDCQLGRKEPHKVTPAHLKHLVKLKNADHNKFDLAKFRSYLNDFDKSNARTKKEKSSAKKSSNEDTSGISFSIFNWLWDNRIATAMFFICCFLLFEKAYLYSPVDPVQLMTKVQEVEINSDIGARFAKSELKLEGEPDIL